MIAQIDRPGDPRLLPYARVGDPAWLRAQGLFVAEGRLVVERLIAARRFRIESVLVTTAAHRALAPCLDAFDAAVLVCSQDTMDGITGFSFHRGCLALAHRPGPQPPDPWTDRDGVILALDGVGNPDNVGGLFRTAAAFGATGILAGPATGDPLYRKAVRTSMGAVLQLPWTSVGSWPAALTALRARGYRVAALTPGADAVALEHFAARRDPRVVLLLGAEGSGLSPETMALADDRLRIRTTTHVDSLNVIVAAGIALHVVTARTLNLEP